MPYLKQTQPYPGRESEMRPRPDFGEQSYRGLGRLADKKAIITDGDSGIGRAVALAFAREGADVPISYLNENDDAEETARDVLSASSDTRHSGQQRGLPPVGRAGQPGELAPIYVCLASAESRYLVGEVIGATGGRPLA